MEILTIDHEDMIAELNRNRFKLNNMLEESRAKTARLNELSQIVINRYSRRSSLKDHQPNFDLTNNHRLPAVAADPTNYDLLNEEKDLGIGLGINPHHLCLYTGGAVRNIGQVDNRNMRSETIPQPPESSNLLDHERVNPNQTPNFQYFNR